MTHVVADTHCTSFMQWTSFNSPHPIVSLAASQATPEKKSPPGNTELKIPRKKYNLCKFKLTPAKNFRCELQANEGIYKEAYDIVFK